MFFSLIHLFSFRSDTVIFLPMTMIGGGGTEPPCRQRRLDPYRQHIRNKCNTEAMQHCSDIRSSIDGVSRDPFLRAMFGDEDGFLSTFVALPSQGQKVMAMGRDPLDDMFNQMIGESLRLFDAAMADLSENAVVTSNVDDAEQSAEATAENALDLMVSSLYQRAGKSSSDTPFNKEDEEALDVNNLSERLFQLGDELLTETHRRRLSEGEVDPHFNVKERLARRLTEYRTDVFYYPDGSITLYTSSQPSVDDTPVLGMGSEDLDDCIYSRYNSQDLSGDCHDAVELFLTATTNHEPFPHDALRAMEQKMEHVQSRLSRENVDDSTILVGDCAVSLMIMLSVYSFVSAVMLYAGSIDAFIWFNMSIVIGLSVFSFGFIAFAVLVPGILVLEGCRHGCHSDGACNDGNAKLPEDDEDDPKQAEIRVFIGVPVQVV